MIMNKQVEFVFIDDDENASNAIKNISCEALMGDNVMVQVSKITPTTYSDVISDIYGAFSKDESVNLRDIYVENCVFACGDKISRLICILIISQVVV